MSNEETTSNAFTEHVAAVGAPVGENGGSERATSLAEFSHAVELLAELEQSGLLSEVDGLDDTVDAISRLAEFVDDSLSVLDDDVPETVETIRFVIDACAKLREVALASDDATIDPEQLLMLQEEAELRLSACTDNFSIGDQRSDSDEWGQTPGDTSEESDVVAPSQEEILAMLGQLSAAQSQGVTEVQRGDANDADDGNETIRGQSKNATGPKVGNSSIVVPEPDQVPDDEDLLEAFLDDATRGLESMEQALLDLESNPGDPAPVKTIGRDLHTIKGASASICLSNLAAYIHEVEELIRETQESGNSITPDLLLPHIDLIRARVHGEEYTAGSTATPTEPAAAPGTPSASTINTSTPAMVATVAPVKSGNSIADAHSADETVRVKASQLNRLMDMLSELVMLRNQRDTEISELKGIHDELVHSVTRIRMLSHEGEALLNNDSFADAALAEEGVSFSHLNEVANDVLESAQRLRDCYRPVADGNEAVSQFIRNFRMELVQLRRTPVSGLFRRLHRAISDAARAENKQVRVELLGDNTGIERSLQERIYEPLMHIVRNSVSHGIESSEDRVAAGKAPQGTVTLHAHSGPDLLVIEVRDDGKGLDYDAIRRRGIERGLIEGDKSISRAELARLIFHPGFSTRESANQISGRGVGMDVVASTLERMRGWVEVDSETGSGSTIRLSLPLPSMIQHAMVFRSGGQLFGLPAQAVKRTGSFDPSLRSVDLNTLLSLNSGEIEEPDHSRRSLIELAVGSSTVEGEAGGDVTLVVDRVLGPEEVVVRPMPPMLKSHPLCVGATLSGMGEVVLLLDPRELADSSKQEGRTTEAIQDVQRTASHALPKVLVVDDSKSARLRVVRSLEKYPVQIEQAEDGQAAMELLAKESFVTVFSDIDMPRMSGLELLETIKSEPRLESIPVIMISSRSIETAGAKSYEWGAKDYIQKPLTQERFDEAVALLPWAAR